MCTLHTTSMPPPDDMADFFRLRIKELFHNASLILGSSNLTAINHPFEDDYQDSLLEIVKQSFPQIDTMDSSFSTLGNKSNQASDFEDTDELLQEFLRDMIELQPSAPSCGPERKRKQSLLEDLEEFVDVLGLDDLGNLEEMEVFAVDDAYNYHNSPQITYSNVPTSQQKNEATIVCLEKSKNHVDIEVSTSVTTKSCKENPALEACDVDSLLEQFEASAVKENPTSVPTVKTAAVIMEQREEKKAAIKEPTLPANIIAKLRELRSVQKKSILIPPKPTMKKAKTNGAMSESPKLRRLLQSPNNTSNVNPAQLKLEHDYCITSMKVSSDDQKPKVDAFFDKIPECDVPPKTEESEKDDTNFDKLPPYLTCFTNKEKFKGSSCSGSVHSNEQVEMDTSEIVAIKDDDMRRSRSRSRSVDSVSDCSTCSTCSSSSRSSYNSYRVRSGSRQSGGQRETSRSRSRRRMYSSGSPEYSPKARCRSTSSQSSHEDRYFSKSRSRSRNNWVNRHWKRNPRRSPSYERNRDRSRSPLYKNKYDSYCDYNNKFRYTSPLSSNFQQKRTDMEERRVIYVGNIPEGTTRDCLRYRFQKFGMIDEVSVHFRDKRDNYGFITFRNQADACDAFENGNKDPNLPKFDLCFGKRRQFCKNRYADLDNIADEDTDCWSNQFDNNNKQERKSQLDFDSLLNAAKSRLGR